MQRKRILGMAASLGVIAALTFQVAPSLASTTGRVAGKSVLVGVLGYEGGAASSKFHPTAGTVEVEFANPPLVLEKQVGDSGHFRIRLSPGSYTVIGCGPAPTGSNPTCGRPKNVTLKADEIDHVRLVWAYAP